MRRLLLIAAVSALTMARPELYREKEDFKYSRSSSDEGSKAGFYDAQRGNMGGNYEKAHNMDNLAQHQMSGLVRQVQGELGDATHQKTGSVFTAANTRGVYGSGNYDLSNLEGRNFQEGTTFEDSQAHSALSQSSAYRHGQSSANSAIYGNGLSSNSRYGAYHGQSGQALQSSNLEEIDRAHTSQYARKAAHQNSEYHSHTGYHAQSAYDQSNSDALSSNNYGANAQSRLISATPVRVIVRPGTRVTIPVAAETYDAAHSGHSAFNQNSINSETELLNSADLQTNLRSSNKPKHYESSYSYRKEWEKHDTKPVPLAIPTPTLDISQNSELYDTHEHTADGQQEASAFDSNHAYSGYNAQRASSATSNQYLQQSAYDAQQHRTASNFNSNAYTHGGYNSAASADLLNPVSDVNSKPKSYQSSYSYHKSWERQGDPYVIKPASNGLMVDQASQKLIGEYVKGGHSSHQHGSRYQQAHINGDCDEEGHFRVARSTDYQNQQSQNLEDLGQQTQVHWGNLEDLGQQTQTTWDRLEDGQQVQNKWDNLELGQQAQKKWDKLEELGQQNQEKWDKAVEDLGQQTQNTWDQSEDAGQQVQNKWDGLEHVGQQTQTQWDKLENLGQQTQKDLGQQTQDGWSKFDITPQETEQQNQNKWDSFDPAQQSQSSSNTEAEKHSNHRDFQFAFNQQEDTPGTDKLRSLDQISQKENDTLIPHLVQNNWHNLDQHESNLNTNENAFAFHQKPEDGFEQNQNNWDKFTEQESTNKETQHSWGTVNILNNDNQNNFKDNIEKVKPVWEQLEDTRQTSTDIKPNINAYSKPETYFTNSYYFGNHNSYHGQQTNINEDKWGTSFHRQYKSEETNRNTFNISSENKEIHQQDSSPLLNFWNKIDNLEKETQNNNEEDSNKGAHFLHDYSNREHSYQDSMHEQSFDTANSNGNFLKETQNDINGKPKPVNKNTMSIPVQQNNPNDVNVTTTTKSPNRDGKVRPMDIGRGDIGPEDLSNDKSIPTTTEKIFTININSEHSSNSNNKRYKTPEEIETLSLTKETNKTNNNIASTGINQNDNKFTDSDLSILSLSQQKWLEDQRRYVGDHYSHAITTNAPTSTTKTISNDLYFTEKQSSQTTNKETQQIAISEEGKVNRNIHNTRPGNYVNEKPKQETQTHASTFVTPSNNDHVGNVELSPIEIERQNQEQQSTDFGPQSEIFDQQNLGQQLVDFGQESMKFDQQNAGQSDSVEQQNMFPENINQDGGFEQIQDNLNNLGIQTQQQHFEGVRLESQNKHSDDLSQQTQENHFEDFSPLQTQQQFNDFGQQAQQQFDDFGQQQTQQQFEDFSQQTQQHYDNIGQQTQQHFDDFGQKVQASWEQVQIAPEIVYKEKQDAIYTQQVNHKAENIQTSNEKKSDQEVVIPEEVTEKPGFWKSVGNKFTSAKDKVASWFQRS